VLAELAAVNAAFSVVKQFVANGRELSDCFQQISTITNAKEDLKNRHQKKKNSVWSSLSGQTDDDIEEFMALEKIKQAEYELESMIKIYGRAGLWEDWIRFQAEARKRRIKEKTEAKKARLKRYNYFSYAVSALVFIVGIYLIVTWLTFLIEQKG
jgi:hypothetical protein